MSVAQRLYEGVNIGARRRPGRSHHLYAHRFDAGGAKRAAGGQSVHIRVVRPGTSARETAVVYRTRSRRAQEAHEGGPTHVRIQNPRKVSRHTWTGAKNRLYELIWRQFVGSQMKPARIRRLTILIEGTKNGASIPYRFRAGDERDRVPGPFRGYTSGSQNKQGRGDRPASPALPGPARWTARAKASTESSTSPSRAAAIIRRPA